MDGLGTCRDRFGEIPANIFHLWSCSMCYGYLFPTKGNQLRPNFPRAPTQLVSSNGSIYGEGFVIYPDVNNPNVTESVCRSLDDQDCERWQDCCHSGQECCRRQIEHVSLAETTNSSYCPMTWDGYGCFSETFPGTTAQITCPTYIKHALDLTTVYKQCTVNGTWERHPDNNQEWTDYTKCVNVLLEGYEQAVYTSIVCDVISLSFLIPACIIFLVFRQLRRQQRIKLHFHLFISFILVSLFRLLWDILIYRERLTVPARETAMHRNTGGCLFLYVMGRYTRMTNFFWMFCEGFYLHRLMVNAFSVPKTLVFYYLFGWGGSTIPIIVYAAIRWANDDGACWVDHAGGIEWIVYTPNLVCLVMNLAMLVNIMRIMLTQLTSHPNEPSNYRRALKATFILVPLFGIQLFAVMYRPPLSADSYKYEMFASVLKNLQGAAIALVFCFINNEVYLHLRNALVRIKKDPFRSEYTLNSSMTTTTFDSSRPSEESLSSKPFLPSSMTSEEVSPVSDRNDHG